MQVVSVTVDDETHETELKVKTVKDFPLLVENYTETVRGDEGQSAA